LIFDFKIFIMVFTAKKVEELPSFSEKIRKAREEAGFSKEKISQLLNFPARYLDYLERGELEKLPADVYSRGFLRKYAKLLDIEPNILILEYEKETKIIRHLNKGVGKHRPLPFLRSTRLVITPKTLGLAAGAIIFLLVLGYLAYEVHFLISPPGLLISTPSQDQITENSVMVVAGEVEPTAKLTINGQIVYVEKDGKFQQEINLSQGLNVIKIEAANRLGKKNSVIRQVVLK